MEEILHENALLLVDVASLQQTADFLIEKELINLVFTGNDVCYNRTYSATSCVEGILLGNGEIFYTLKEAQVIIVRIPLIPPHDSEGIRHPVPIQVAGVFRLIPPPLVGA